MNEIKENLKKRLAETTVLDNFKKLTSDVEKERVNAGITLLRHLNSIDDSEKRESEYTYALDRLVKGVGATRFNSKTGFYTVLVALLTKTPSITIENLFESIKKHLSTASSKSEDANISMGQILVCGAIIHSGRFEIASTEQQHEILRVVLDAGKKKSYLSLAASTFIVELMEKVTEEQFKNIWNLLKPEISKPWKEQRLDTIYLLIKAKLKFPNIITNKYILKTLDSHDIVAADSITQLSEILMNNPTVSTVKHPLYPEIAKLVVKNNLTKQFFTELDNLLPKSNRNKQLIITNLLILTLQNLNNFSVIPDLLTTNYVKCTVHSFKHARPYEKDELFFTTMMNFFKILVNKLQLEDVKSKTKLEVIEKLLFYPGTFIFEKITKTKVIQQITIGLNGEEVKKLVEIYKKVVTATKPKMISPTESENWVNLDRIYAAQLIVKLLPHPSVQKDVNWRLDQLKFFLTNSLFKMESDNIGAELANALKDCFYHSLDQKLAKLEDMRNILSSLISFINKIIFNGETELRNPISDELIEIWKEMVDLVDKLESKNKNNYAVPVFHTLVLHMGLQLFNEPDLAKNTLKELQSCFARLETKKSSKKQKLNEDEPEWIEVIIDLFLSLLSHNSHLIRSIIKCVFPHLCSNLSLTALRQILDVLDPKNETNPLSKETESDSESSDDESDEEESSQDSGLEDDEEIEESAADRMRIAVRQALHKTGYQTDDESEDLDNIDEEEGKKLDTALAEAFKLLKKPSKGRKNKQNKDDQSLTHFRVRVLDLIEIYLDSEPVMLNCLEIACLLLQTLEFSIRDIHQKPLENRLRNCLKKLSQIKKFNSTADTSEDILATFLESFLDKGSKSAFIYQDMRDIITECCVFVIKCSQIIKTSDEDRVSQIFSKSLQTFFEKRDCPLPVSLFKSILQMSWTGIWHLVPKLVDYGFNNDIRPYRRTQALELLKSFYSNNRFRSSNLDNFKKKMKEIEKKLSNKTIELLDNLNIKDKYICVLLNLLTQVKTVDASKNMKWEKIGELVRNYRSQVSLSKASKKAFDQFCRALGISNLVEMQVIPTIKHEESSESDSENPSKEEKRLEKKRKKASSMKKDKQKAKKEAKLLRVKAGSEGLQDLNFSSVNLPEESKEKKSRLENGVEEQIKNKVNGKYRSKRHISNLDNKSSKKQKLK